jgi:hypothetical protein
MGLDQEILINILAIDKAIEDYEFIHTYLGPEEFLREAAAIKVDAAYSFLGRVLEELDGTSGDTLPPYRRIYFHDLIRSVLTQIECFVFKQEKTSFKESIECLIGTSICPKFDIEAELNRLIGFLNQIGYPSLPSFRNRKKKVVEFEHEEALSTYLNQLIDVLTRMTLNRYQPLFPLDLAGVLEKSQLALEFTSGEPPCYYYYRKAYQGIVGVTFHRVLSEIDLKNFIAHEVIPGHHFYYLLKQAELDQGTTDLISSLDIYYSPENIINEGIAMNSDLIFEGLLEDEVVAAQKIEKFFHKIFYNSWYNVNIENIPVDPFYVMILRKEFNFAYDLIDVRMNYFTREAKFYTPCYPVGSSYVEQLIQRFGISVLPKLYNQHSVNTITDTILPPIDINQCKL